MFRGRVDISTEVKLIDLPEGNDVDPVDVTAAHLRGNKEFLCTVQPWTPEENCKCEKWIKLCTSHTV